MVGYVGDDFITKEIEDVLGLEASDNYTIDKWRGKTLRHFQAVYGQLWCSPLDFQFTYDEGTLTSSATGAAVEAPDGYRIMGASGSVRLTDSPAAFMAPIIPQQYNLLRESLGPTNPSSSYPSFYMISGLGANGRPNFWFMPWAAKSVTIRYRTATPVLVDAASGDNFSKIPGSYHDSLVFPWVAYKLCVDQENWEAAAAYKEMRDQALRDFTGAAFETQEATFQWGDEGIPRLGAW